MSNSSGTLVPLLGTQNLQLMVRKTMALLIASNECEIVNYADFGGDLIAIIQMDDISASDKIAELDSWSQVLSSRLQCMILTIHMRTRSLHSRKDKPLSRNLSVSPSG